MSVPIGGGTPTALSSVTQARIVDVVVDSTSLYYLVDHATPPGGAVMRIPVGCGNPVTLATLQAAPLGHTVDQSSVNWIGVDGTIMRGDLGGDVPATVATSSDVPGDLVSDGMSA